MRVRHSALNYLTPLTISRAEGTAEQFVIIYNVIPIHNILSIFIIHYVIKLIYEEN